MILYRLCDIFLHRLYDIFLSSHFCCSLKMKIEELSRGRRKMVEERWMKENRGWRKMVEGKSRRYWSVDFWIFFFFSVHFFFFFSISFSFTLFKPSDFCSLSYLSSFLALFIFLFFPVRTSFYLSSSCFRFHIISIY